jgi:pimeloyl-ACP methyl ester carboxylesterase
MLAACATSVSGQVPPESAPLPPPGRLIVVGGWRLHLHCTGTIAPAQPTVVLEAGMGDFSVEWSLVQPAVARFARVCSYDRAGDGWSDLGPNPRTLHQIVDELHTLLERSGESAPYLLVGHSFGGGVVRLYQSTYPPAVAGLVLIDAGSDNPVRLLGNGRLGHASDLATGAPIPPVRRSGPLRESDVPAAAMSQMKAAAANAARNANPGSRSKLPPDAQRMRTWVLSRWQHAAAGFNPVESDELMALRAARLKSEHALGDLPLVVLTRGLPDEQGPDAQALEEEHRKEQAEIAALSRRGEQVIATQSGHHIQLDEPDLVIETIRRLVATARK